MDITAAPPPGRAQSTSMHRRLHSSDEHLKKDEARLDTPINDGVLDRVVHSTDKLLAVLKSADCAAAASCDLVLSPQLQEKILEWLNQDFVIRGSEDSLPWEITTTLREVLSLFPGEVSLNGSGLLAWLLSDREFLLSVLASSNIPPEECEHLLEQLLKELPPVDPSDFDFDIVWNEGDGDPLHEQEERLLEFLGNRLPERFQNIGVDDVALHTFCAQKIGKRYKPEVGDHLYLRKFIIRQTGFTKFGTHAGGGAEHGCVLSVARLRADATPQNLVLHRCSKQQRPPEFVFKVVASQGQMFLRSCSLPLNALLQSEAKCEAIGVDGFEARNGLINILLCNRHIHDLSAADHKAWGRLVAALALGERCLDPKEVPLLNDRLHHALTLGDRAPGLTGRAILDVLADCICRHYASYSDMAIPMVWAATQMLYGKLPDEELQALWDQKHPIFKTKAQQKKEVALESDMGSIEDNKEDALIELLSQLTRSEDFAVAEVVPLLGLLLSILLHSDSPLEAMLIGHSGVPHVQVKSGPHVIHSPIIGTDQIRKLIDLWLEKGLSTTSRLLLSHLLFSGRLHQITANSLHRYSAEQGGLDPLQLAQQADRLLEPGNDPLLVALGLKLHFLAYMMAPEDISFRHDLLVRLPQLLWGIESVESRASLLYDLGTVLSHTKALQHVAPLFTDASAGSAASGSGVTFKADAHSLEKMSVQWIYAMASSPDKLVQALAVRTWKHSLQGKGFKELASPQFLHQLLDTLATSNLGAACDVLEHASSQRVLDSRRCLEATLRVAATLPPEGGRAVQVVARLRLAVLVTNTLESIPKSKVKHGGRKSSKHKQPSKALSKPYLSLISALSTSRMADHAMRLMKLCLAHRYFQASNIQVKNMWVKTACSCARMGPQRAHDALASWQEGHKLGLLNRRSDFQLLLNFCNALTDGLGHLGDEVPAEELAAALMLFLKTERIQDLHRETLAHYVARYLDTVDANSPQYLESVDHALKLGKQAIQGSTLKRGIEQSVRTDRQSKAIELLLTYLPLHEDTEDDRVGLIMKVLQMKTENGASVAQLLTFLKSADTQTLLETHAAACLQAYSILLSRCDPKDTAGTNQTLNQTMEMCRLQDVEAKDKPLAGMLVREVGCLLSTLDKVHRPLQKHIIQQITPLLLVADPATALSILKTITQNGWNFGEASKKELDSLVCPLLRQCLEDEGIDSCFNLLGLCRENGLLEVSPMLKNQHALMVTLIEQCEDPRLGAKHLVTLPNKETVEYCKLAVHLYGRCIQQQSWDDAEKLLALLSDLPHMEEAEIRAMHTDFYQILLVRGQQLRCHSMLCNGAPFINAFNYAAEVEKLLSHFTNEGASGAHEALTLLKHYPDIDTDFWARVYRHLAFHPSDRDITSALNLLDKNKKLLLDKSPTVLAQCYCCAAATLAADSGSEALILIDEPLNDIGNGVFATDEGAPYAVVFYSHLIPACAHFFQDEQLAPFLHSLYDSLLERYKELQPALAAPQDLQHRIRIETALIPALCHPYERDTSRVSVSIFTELLVTLSDHRDTIARMEQSISQRAALIAVELAEHPMHPSKDELPGLAYQEAEMQILKEATADAKMVWNMRSFVNQQFAFGSQFRTCINLWGERLAECYEDVLLDPYFKSDLQQLFITATTHCARTAIPIRIAYGIACCEMEMLTSPIATYIRETLQFTCADVASDAVQQVHDELQYCLPAITRWLCVHYDGGLDEIEFFLKLAKKHEVINETTAGQLWNEYHYASLDNVHGAGHEPVCQRLRALVPHVNEILQHGEGAQPEACPMSIQLAFDVLISLSCRDELRESYSQIRNELFGALNPNYYTGDVATLTVDTIASYDFGPYIEFLTTLLSSSYRYSEIEHATNNRAEVANEIIKLLGSPFKQCPHLQNLLVKLLSDFIYHHYLRPNASSMSHPTYTNAELLKIAEKSGLFSHCPEKYTQLHVVCHQKFPKKPSISPADKARCIVAIAQEMCAVFNGAHADTAARFVHSALQWKGMQSQTKILSQCLGPMIIGARNYPFKNFVHVSTYNTVWELIEALSVRHRSVEYIPLVHQLLEMLTFTIRREITCPHSDDLSVINTRRLHLLALWAVFSEAFNSAITGGAFVDTPGQLTDYLEQYMIWSQEVQRAERTFTSSESFIETLRIVRERYDSDQNTLETIARIAADYIETVTLPPDAHPPNAIRKHLLRFAADSKCNLFHNQLAHFLRARKSTLPPEPSDAPPS